MKIKYILSLLIFKLISSVSMTNSLDSDRMYIFFEERVFEIHLIESDITNELISILPLKTKIMEENTNMDNHRYTIPLWADIEVSSFILEQENNKYIKKGRRFSFCSFFVISNCCLVCHLALDAGSRCSLSFRTPIRNL